MPESVTYQEMTDEDLVVLVQKHDDEAANELYQRHVQAMMEMIQRKLRSVAGRGWYDSEGIVNSGFRSFFSQVQKPDVQSDQWKAVALLSRIVQRKFLVQARRKSAPRSHDPETLRLIAENAIAMSADADSMQVAEACLNEVMAAALAEATDQDRRILERWLDKDGERTLDDIAEECFCSLSAVKGCLKRFESRLRELMVEGESDRS